MKDDTGPVFPPLMSGEATDGHAFDHAIRRAVLGCDAGLVVHALGAAEMQAALVMAPEVPLSKAMTMLPLCAVGFQNALGALAPPEVAVHLAWDGGLRVNGARCGRLRIAASETDPEAQPDWLVIGLELPLMPPSEDGGVTPDETALFAEGCADVAPPALLESWARHVLNWIARWEDQGTRALHAEWRGLAWGMGEDTTQGDLTGHYLGVDEDFGMLLRSDETTHLIPLTTLLESPS
ncbi:biotin/lipoate--protein ligase family protein [Pacificoceanicola onchidii]|uniref:biotin/lipoate--protein ligase family protein n=1 Tax=Pacificoceanicola onchidii TaxID=2562685 RepID=UPI0010A55B59|nr:biotin/lipoate--protein ligase family protein [Pacificoceanicola onchidii]